jgi:hypothetical protein
MKQLHFSSRRRWSVINQRRAARLIQQGRMTELGLAKIEVAKALSNWGKEPASGDRPGDACRTQSGPRREHPSQGFLRKAGAHLSETVHRLDHHGQDTRHEKTASPGLPGPVRTRQETGGWSWCGKSVASGRRHGSRGTKAAPSSCSCAATWRRTSNPPGSSTPRRSRYRVTGAEPASGSLGNYRCCCHRGRSLRR